MNSRNKTADWAKVGLNALVILSHWYEMLTSEKALDYTGT